MSGFRRIPQELKDQVLLRAKEGVSVVQLSKDHGVSTKAIYSWIAKSAGQPPSLLAMARLKRERDDLLRLIGELSLRISRREKNHDG